MCTNIPEEDGIRILITCWAIWHARRKAIHEGKFQSPLATMGAINRLINELQISNELKGWNSSKRDIGKRTHTWIPPPEPSLHKLNVDAAVSTKGSIGAVAAVCRNDQSVFVAASATACRLADTETLEAMVCVEALALAEDWDSTDPRENKII
ncbi:hypothetical protein PVAP13_8NG195901 [Panicum virgatum]|uniref:RNase H type-1 domain-containing protein n=1 Tax=Panicum virgatum TaxID=38727 RepID=A0A8T0P496_PANVG|nr:hypothetical protein PVAP13_8NG195901 [Panicum virgatum]